ncbi:hypothetical protein [Halobellus sp. H-GB7]|uniref:hypothetical protein n=1 Tax=Halobellus sp. H-GB7 TaxID=3069756 RepID=UPI0027AEA97F|nr:hypothetical protein [Halobellus sp. H-GB7]MDQ2054822.1 hypothetical protein [Halobellus sp. H-GB7]
MNQSHEEKWSDLESGYPEVAEALLSYAGFTESSTAPDLTEEDRFLLDVLKDDFDQGSGDDLFDEIKRSRGSRLGEDSRLREREFVDERLDRLASQGLVGRIPLKEGGYHYGPLRMCIYYLMDRGETDEVVVDDLYWLKDVAGVPVGKLVLTALDMTQASMTLTEVR